VGDGNWHAWTNGKQDQGFGVKSPSNEPTMTKDLEGLWEFLWLFQLFHGREVLNEIFCNMLLKILIIDPIHHMFRVSLCWIHVKVLKVCRFFFKFCISFKKMIIISNHTKNMLTIVNLSFFHHKLKYSFAFHLHYASFTCGKWLLKLKQIERYIELLKNSNFVIFLLWVFFKVWVVDYYHLLYFPSKFIY
jgi:hypothetical protein